MPKVDIDLVKAILQRMPVSLEDVSKAMSDLHAELKKQEALKKPRTHAKKKFLFVAYPLRDIIVSSKKDEDGIQAIESMASDCEKMRSGWVIQVLEDENEALIFEKINLVVSDFNNSLKGRRHPVRRLSDAMEFIPSLFWKSQNIWVKTREPVLLLHPPMGMVFGSISAENELKKEVGDE
nr:MAG TPA: hypothetical protein [Caudoviricetes sp.]